MYSITVAVRKYLSMAKIAQLFHFGIVSISVGIFLLATLSLVKDYYSRKTGIHTHFITGQYSEFPTLTFCPMNVVKDANSDLAKYFEVDDLFDTSHGIFRNPKYIRVRKIFSPAIGYCFALQISFPSKEKAFDLNLLSIKSLQKYSLYIHESGLEYWIPFTPPVGVAMTEIDASQENIKGAQLVIKEQVLEAINSKENPCSLGTNAEEFTICALNQMPKSKCSAFIEEFNGKLENVCQTREDMIETLEQGYKSMKKILYGSDANCIWNCRSRIFSQTKTYYSEYGLNQIYELPKENSSFIMYIWKPDFWLRQEDEYIVMTFWSFLSDFGGNLGLFLGGSIISISCFILIQMPDYLKKKFTA